MAHDNLEDFNKEGVLTHLLAIEEHIVGNNGIKINTWCQRKHFLLGNGHHAFELQQLLSSKDPDLSNRLGEFRERWRSVMDNSPSAAEVRDLRNEFRQLVGDETLMQSPAQCGVCALDRRSTGLSNTRLTTGVQLAVAEPEGNNNGKILLLLGGITAGLIIFFWLKKRREEQSKRTRAFS